MNPVDLAELLTLDETGFRRRFRNTPLWRIKHDGLLRNTAMVLENKQPYCE
jgi:epoxyqueuosine reductase QueG